MRRLITIGVLSLALALLSGCSREDPRVSRANMLDEQKSRSTEQVAELRNRLSGQSQR
ncbi:MAG: hypothetical protein OET44_03345 [Gammaproteobacteria bacterium]|nr:hypothetical protein [Gammaproteobacteria bacterium]